MPDSRATLTLLRPTQNVLVSHHRVRSSDVDQIVRCLQHDDVELPERVGEFIGGDPIFNTGDDTTLTVVEGRATQSLYVDLSFLYNDDRLGMGVIQFQEFLETCIFESNRHSPYLHRQIAGKFARHFASENELIYKQGRMLTTMLNEVADFLYHQSKEIVMINRYNDVKCNVEATARERSVREHTYRILFCLKTDSHDTLFDD